MLKEAWSRVAKMKDNINQIAEDAHNDVRADWMLATHSQHPGISKGIDGLGLGAGSGEMQVDSLSSFSSSGAP